MQTGERLAQSLTRRSQSGLRIRESGQRNIMAYHTTAYLIVFLPVTACIYQLARRDKRRYVLLLAGYYFFWTFSKMLLFFLIGTTLFTHYICLWMTRIREQKLSFAMRECEKPHRKTGNSKEEKKLLIFGILVLLGVLGYLKYHNFFVANWNILADRIGFISPLQEKELLIPIGISFYTLQAIGYMADVYWSKAEVYPHPGKIALFLGFFSADYGGTDQLIYTDGGSVVER